MIVYLQKDVTAAAGKEAFADVFTSTTEQKYKLLSVTCNNVTATIDLLIKDERETIADIPADVKAIGDKWIDFDRDIKIGNKLAVGQRNGTGASVTVAFCLKVDIT